MDIVFMGTAEFGVPALRALNRHYPVRLVITKADKPAGRGMRKSESPIKKAAKSLGLDVYQPQDVSSKESLENIREVSPDCYVVAAYGQILSGECLDLVQWPVNIHASLLPDYRGAAPINWAIIEGEEKSGVTTMVMEEGLDTGPILLQRSVPIGENETAGELHDKLSELGSDLILETLEGIEEDKIEPKPQPENGSHAPRLSSEDGLIDWSEPSELVHNRVRGMNPWPGAYTFYEDRRINVHRTRDLGSLSSGSGNSSAGEVIGFTNGSFTVLCGEESAVEILEVQPASKQKMDAVDFINGFHLQRGDQFG